MNFAETTGYAANGQGGGIYLRNGSRLALQDV